MLGETPIKQARWPKGIPSDSRAVALHVCRTFPTENCRTEAPYLPPVLAGVTGAEVAGHYETARYKKSAGYDAALLEAHRNYREVVLLWVGRERLRLSSLLTTLHTLRALVAGGEAARVNDGKIIRDYLREEWNVADPPTRERQSAFVESVVKLPHADLMGAS